MTWALVVVDGLQWQGVSAVGQAARVSERIQALVRGFSEAGEKVFHVENALERADLSASPGKGQQVLRRYGTDAFAGSGLARQLREAGVHSIVLCGTGTDSAIDATAKRALANGFDLILASDAHLAFDRGALRAESIVEHYNSVLAELVTPGQVIEVLPTAELLAVLRDEPAMPAAVGW